MTIGEMLEKKYKEFGSVEQLARWVGCTYLTMHGWLHGRHKPSKVYQRKLSELKGEYEKTLIHND